MTDEQIVKGLECCVSRKGCDACEFYMHDTCFVVRHKEIFDLIKRQQAEIEELKKVGNKIDSLGAVAALMDQKERLACFKNEWEREVRAEAVREFAEKLKKWKYQSSDWSHGEHPFVVEETDIDELVIEMTEKEGGAE